MGIFVYFHAFIHDHSNNVYKKIQNLDCCAFFVLFNIIIIILIRYQQQFHRHHYHYRFCFSSHPVIRSSASHILLPFIPP